MAISSFTLFSVWPAALRSSAFMRPSSRIINEMRPFLPSASILMVSSTSMLSAVAIASIISEETASRLSIIFHHWFPNYLNLTFCATFDLDTTSRCDRSCQNNNGQNQSFFLAPVNTTAHLSSFVFGIIPSLPLSTALLEPQMHAVRSPQDLRAFYDQLRLQL